MEATEVPFVKLVGIKRKVEGTLKLDYTHNIQNHIQTIHGAAQFALAETQSGIYLQSLFPQYIDKVIPLLRSSTVKYRQLANGEIYAIASVDDESISKFEAQFIKKGRALITVKVEVKDTDEVTTMVGEFVWFVALS